ncbi:MAG: bifunctional ADP-dependent (S)-NAD(P)H-hydrate dehydratase/NAD(P)H-hydrate epimerase [Acidovorax sp. SCN 65-28]|uniref:NAD(P)H-hydrate dehydratase n=1 Tax=Acidovorax sp. TaxID=1872122 RepID=UPI00086E79AF|nr:NAD(P)H-hydrate dehydratase [Acidovorax sp.]MBN9627694.1 NAD(P)H-hydrate dehydratase [Acidovorax sp.]ODS69944.1 MAG: bifunctional ADP-dependent (S)-NAD(P)H-hydrate dehydratase/NAD(P)H-hydrate epimerase [Acidovorax sp. SCN 65-28]
MHRITPYQPHPLFNTAATRRLEKAAAATLPPHTLMQRAGLAVAQLAQALAPHARTVWIACGPGNNGGDGLEAAMHLQRSGRKVVVTWLGQPDTAPADAKASWQRARDAGVAWADTAPDDLDANDLCIDALLGIGVSSSPGSAARAPDARLQACLQALNHSPAPVLAVDLPSGLDADTGQFAAGLTPDTAPHPHYLLRQRTPPPRHTLSLLTLKPGLFTAAGRDAAGQVWLDDLGVEPGHEPPNAWLSGPALPAPRAHASHKGSYGDVAVVGGEGLAARGMGMAGAALLAASAALYSGAGRVLVALLDDGHLQLDLQQPELMLRRFDELALEQLTVVCGCGGGQAIAHVLPEVIARAARLVLDADALNTIATQAALHALVVARGQHGQPTVITPHPLEAARLLGLTTAEVQADRLNAAQQLADQFNCVAVLKGSGTVIAAPDRAPAINPTGNARLAAAGTGDVLAGMVGAHLAAGASALRAASEAVYQHGQAADVWPAGLALTASALARRVGG